MNETLNCIFKRYSCRAFTDQKISDENIGFITKAAVAAPSAMNNQPWKVIAIKNKALIDEMDAEGMKVISEADDKGMYNRMMERGGKLFYNTPLMVIVPTKKGAELDCGILCENMVIAAESLGINSLICGLARLSFTGTKGADFKKRIQFPEDYEIGMTVLFGYAEKDGKPHEPDLSKITVIG